MKSHIHTKVMRRVYYSFALSFLEQSLLWAGLALGGAIALLGRLTHVAAIGHNLAAVPVGAVPQYLVNTVLNAVAAGELLTIVTVLTIAALSAAAGYKLSRVSVSVQFKWAH